MDHSAHQNHDAERRQYARFGLMLLLSFLAMYALMYAMVDVLGNALPNLNQFYMAGLMVAPMAVFELLLMGSMYANRSWNIAIIAVAVVALFAFWFAIRQQAAIGDRQFLRSMIPHHAGAILMCERANVSDAEIQALCRSIVSGQQQEIDQMKALLEKQTDTKASVVEP